MDVIVATELSVGAKPTVKSVDQVKPDEMILDIGPQTIKNYQTLLNNAKTILWNGPLGVFEMDQFAAGTSEVAQSVAKSDAFTLAGGGDTLAAISKFGIADKLSYISTGGGAFLAFLEGKQLPGVAILEQRSFDSDSIGQIN